MRGRRSGSSRHDPDTGWGARAILRKWCRTRTPPASRWPQRLHRPRAVKIRAGFGHQDPPGRKGPAERRALQIPPAGWSGLLLQAHHLDAAVRAAVRLRLVEQLALAIALGLEPVRTTSAPASCRRRHASSIGWPSRIMPSWCMASVITAGLPALSMISSARFASPSQLKVSPTMKSTPASRAQPTCSSARRSRLGDSRRVPRPLGICVRSPALTLSARYATKASGVGPMVVADQACRIAIPWNGSSRAAAGSTTA